MTLVGKAAGSRRPNAPGELAFDGRLDAFVAVPLAGFVLVLIAFGGSSRADAVQIAFLRPLACLLLLFPLLRWHSKSLDQLKPILIGLSGLVVIMIAQLIPLPAWVWDGSEVRGTVAELDHLILGEPIWRPISLVPGRTLNALFSLVVPFAALVLAIRCFSSNFQPLLLIAILITVDALLGIGQVAMGRTSFLYLYEKTNPGSPVGIFANENHSAVFSAIGLIVFGKLGLRCSENKQLEGVIVWFALGAALATLSILISGSRAGLVLGGFAAASSTVSYLVFCNRSRLSGVFGRAPPWGSRKGLVLSLLAAFAFITTVLAFALLGRSPAFSGVFGQDAFADLRWRITPILQEMITDFWLFGAGFGAFEEVYHFYEPTELILPSYINQAHNDWAQLAIEGGAVSVVALIAFILSLARHYAGNTNPSPSPTFSKMLWFSILTIVSVASLVDYPLRTPTFQAVAVWLIAALLLERSSVRGSGVRSV